MFMGMYVPACKTNPHISANKSWIFMKLGTIIKVSRIHKCACIYLYLVMVQNLRIMKKIKVAQEGPYTSNDFHTSECEHAHTAAINVKGTSMLDLQPIMAWP